MPVQTAIRAARRLAGGAALLVCTAQAVAGVTPEVSRVVFDEGAVEQSLQLFNVNAYPVLVQAWVDDGQVLALPHDSKAPIVALPPIFRMDRGDQASLRLLHAGTPLPADRESLFWLNLYEIPATQKRGAADQTVTVTMRTQIKVFVRPAGLPYRETELTKRVTFALVPRPDGTTLSIGNPTPYYATFGALQLTIDGTPRHEAVDMIAPFSQAAVDLGTRRVVAGERAKVVFSLLGDDGNPMVGERDIAAPPSHAPAR